MSPQTAFWLALAAHGCATALAHADEPDTARFECLRAAYPTHVAALEPDPDGARWWVRTAAGRFPWDDGRGEKTFADRLAAPDLEDTLAGGYPIGDLVAPPAPDDDPGRVRHDGFLESLYGATPAAVRANLEVVEWMPRHEGGRLRFNGRQGAAAALRRVSAELDALPPRFHQYVLVTAGTFNWRRIAGTDRRSAHSYAIAIDINTRFTDYWRWSLRREPSPRYRNRIPLEIVRVFERHGFVWGGKWFHYDTMHFEYRPELLQPGCVRLPTALAHRHSEPIEGVSR